MALVCTFGWDGITANECNASGIAISVMAALFVFSQMWFVYCNGKVGRAVTFCWFIYDFDSIFRLWSEITSFEAPIFQIAINGNSRYYISLGLMHLVATNLWLWIRYILYEEAQTLKEIRVSYLWLSELEWLLQLAKFDHNSTSTSDILQDLLAVDSHGGSHHDDNNSTDFIHALHTAHDCKGVQCLFGEFSEFMWVDYYG